MSVRLEILQIARLATRMLGDSARLVRDFLLGQFDENCAGRDRDGRADLYYTVFALAGLQALQEELPVAGVVRGRKLTSWPAIQTDVKNAGGNWVDAEVVVDNGLVTSRKPADLSAFNQKMIEEFAEGVHAGRSEIAHRAG